MHKYSNQIDIEDLQENFNELPAKSAKEVYQAAKEWELEVIAIGRHRLVVETQTTENKLVAKIGFTSEGTFANEIEWRIWNSSLQEKESVKLQSLLCPAKDLLKSGALIQEKCLPISSALNKSEETLFAIKKLASFGITDTAINLGIYKNQVVCYDYSVISPKLYEIIFKK